MDIEKLLKVAYRRLKEEKMVKPIGHCLSEEDIACFIDDKIKEAEREKLCIHILSCRKCADNLRDHFLVIKSMKEKGLLETPTGLIESAQSLVDVEVGQNILDIVLNFKERAIELVRTTGEVLIGQQLIPVPALRSSGKDRELQNEIKVVKTFGDILTEVDIEKKRSDLANIVIRVTKKVTNKKAEGLRISLVKDNRELESFLVEEGKVKFEEIEPNNYRILITEDDRKLGFVNISMKT